MQKLTEIMGILIKVVISVALIIGCVALSQTTKMILWGIGFTTPLNSFWETLLILSYHACPVISFIIGWALAWKVWKM
jgi:hypothetical protein